MDTDNPETSASGHHFSGKEFPSANLPRYFIIISLCIKLENPDTVGTNVSGLTRFHCIHKNKLMSFILHFEAIPALI